ncbi:HAD family hydrolase [Plantibacter sp. MCCC 1A11337]|uniref:HAD family hydrolase n=1 Tax=Plantibacter sp. MCCC 1A11337 TaxID=2736644 RepID=UPI0015821AAD|nr:HAD-IIB family hydrolase [Plantibacter sp. MCCC 1A11337]NUJ89758.1 HAD family hydrolase [Plantibacter sp. MCCC 1A11337]
MTDEVTTTATPLLIALDIDGTVLHEDGSLSLSVADEVRRVVSLGHIVTLATGRSWESTRPVLEELELTPQYVVCANGALIMKRDESKPDSYERFFTETFDPTEVLGLIQPHLSEGSYMVEYPDGFRKYTVGVEDWNLENAIEVPFEELVTSPVTRVVVVSPSHDEEEFLRIVDEIGLSQVSYAIGWTAWLDIAPKGVNKATALERVREWLGLERSQMVAVGDGRNDVDMLGWAAAGGRGVAMGQAPEEVLAVASEVTGTVTDDGLSQLLRSISG